MFAHAGAIDYASVIYLPATCPADGVLNFRGVFLVVSQNKADFT